VTYVDYIDEQKRYPKASARFITRWLREHIATEEKVVRDVEMEDQVSEISTEGHSPGSTARATTDGSVTPEDESEVEQALLKKQIKLCEDQMTPVET